MQWLSEQWKQSRSITYIWRIKNQSNVIYALKIKYSINWIIAPFQPTNSNCWKLKYVYYNCIEKQFKQEVMEVICKYANDWCTRTQKMILLKLIDWSLTLEI